MNSWELPEHGGGLERRSVAVGLKLRVRRRLVCSEMQNTLRDWCMTCVTLQS